MLRIATGAGSGNALPVDRELLLGRVVGGPGQLEGDLQISGRHARVAVDGSGRLVIEDLGSSNGTYVNGDRISGSRVLNPGDRIRLGQTELVVEGNGAGAPAVPVGAAAPAPAPALAPAAAPPAPNGGGTAPPWTPPTDPPTPPAAAFAPPPGAAAPPPPPVTPAPKPTPQPIAIPQGPQSAVEGSGGTLLYGGKRIPIAASGVTIGRAEDCTLPISDALASRHQARVELTPDGFVLTDLGSRNGTLINGERVRGESRLLSSGDTITVGAERIQFVGGSATRVVSAPQQPVQGTQIVHLSGAELTLGRDPSNDVVLTDPNVSRFHAAVVQTPGGYELRDLGSRNGTRLNGQPIERAPLATGSELGIGPFRLVFDGVAFVARDDRGALRLSAEDLTVDVKGKRILDRVSLEVQPGEFVAIIGESGAGKSTLIKALAGVSSPTGGHVLVNGEPVEGRVSELGYVPQDEIVHSELSVREELDYAARLRLPRDTSGQELHTAVTSVLDELALVEHAETRVGSLSGGQRKRAGFGVELVNRPGLLFLDEATTGLDPGLEGRVMKLMRQLATSERAVITITHATKNLGLCDKVAIMGRGGVLTFYGRPDDALRFFGVSDYDGLYEALERSDPADWRARWLEQTAQYGEPQQRQLPRPTARPRTDRPMLAQAAILAARYVKLLVRDRRNMAILLGQVPVLAILIAILFHRDVLKVGLPGEVSSAFEIIFLLVTLVLWLGSIDATREIIRERPSFERERAVGVKTSAYLLSKLTVLFGLAAVQTVVLAGLLIAMRPLHSRLIATPELIGLLVATSWVAVTFGLLLSSWVNTENQATSLIPLALIPQLLFAGQLKALHELPGVIKVIAGGVFARWSFAAAGGALDFNMRMRADPQIGGFQLQHYGTSFFSLRWGPALGILAVFAVVFLTGTVIGLRRSRG